MDKRLTGIFGENLVCDYYKKLGYKILDKNYKCRFGELDIAAIKNDLVVIIEVKTRKNSDFAKAKNYVTISKQNKIRTATLSFLQSMKLDDNMVRFDVAEVYMRNNKPEINIIYQAF